MRISGLISVLLGLACFAAGGTAAVPPAAPEAKDTAPGPSRSDAGKPQSPAKSPARFRWEQVENESLALVGPCGIVWRLNFGPKLTKPYFHPLQTVDGRCLTQVSPKDHPWHYGLWHSGSTTPARKSAWCWNIFLTAGRRRW
ncbi:MAG: PmoA family protein [Opitutae bacterium]|nr:PmoA family protein [Opitutae bacterium]